MDEEHRCYGCNSKTVCESFFLDDYFSSNICPCRMCLVKMVCSQRIHCKDHEAFWKRNVKTHQPLQKGKQL